jgi:hypothetical protein
MICVPILGGVYRGTCAHNLLTGWLAGRPGLHLDEMLGRRLLSQLQLQLLLLAVALCNPRSNTVAAAARTTPVVAFSVPVGPGKSHPEGTKGRRKRKNRGYWDSQANFRMEIRSFWEARGIKSDTIPSNTLLEYYRHFGLKSAIWTKGGHESLGFWLGAKSIPGRWPDAVNTPEVEELIRRGELRAPTGPRGGATVLLESRRAGWQSARALRVAKRARAAIVINGNVQEGRPRQGWKPYRYWKDEKNMAWELYNFLDTKSKSEWSRPAVWLPRKKFFERAGRSEMGLAVTRYPGGVQALCHRLMLVPPREWMEFESFSSLLQDLLQYCESHGCVGVMPRLVDLDSNGCSSLRVRIAQNGGRKLLARKLNMVLDSNSVGAGTDGAGPGFGSLGGVSFGDFDLHFAVELLGYIRDFHVNRPLGLPSGPVRRKEASHEWDSHIAMPFRTDLLKDRKVDLVLKIEEYGGFENVARRLGLHFEDRTGKELRRLETSVALRYRAARAQRGHTPLE